MRAVRRAAETARERAWTEEQARLAARGQAPDGSDPRDFTRLSDDFFDAFPTRQGSSVEAAQEPHIARESRRRPPGRVPLSSESTLPPMLMTPEEMHFHHAVQHLVRTGHLPLGDPVVRALLQDARRTSMGAQLRELERRIQALPRWKYVRARYKPQYTHGPGTLRPPFSASLPPAPVSLDLLDDTESRPGEQEWSLERTLAAERGEALRLASQPMGNNVPVCAGCDCALRSAAAEPEFWLYFLPCGHVIDGACRERLGGPKSATGSSPVMSNTVGSNAGSAEPSHTRPPSVERDGSAQDGTPPEDTSGPLSITDAVAAGQKRKRQQDGEAAGQDQHDQPSPSEQLIQGSGSLPAQGKIDSGKHPNSARGTDGWHRLVACPAEGCQEHWVYEPGQPTSATRLFA